MAQTVGRWELRFAESVGATIILKIDKSAAEADMKKAYRKLAMKLHPDKCKLTGGEEAFKKVSAAFSCLSDASKRSHYDTWGNEQPQGSGGFRGFGAGDVDAEQLFRHFFAQAGHGHGFGRAGRSGNHGGAVDIGGIVSGLMSSCMTNPWLAVTLLCFVSSAWSLVEMVLGNPLLLVLPFLIPAEYRKQAAVIGFMLMASGMFS